MNRKSITQEYYALTTDKYGNMPPMRRDQSNAGTVVAGFMDMLLNNIITVEKKTITVVKELPDELGHIGSLYTYLNEKSCTTDKMMSDYYTGVRIRQLSKGVGESLLADGSAAVGSGGLFGPKITYITEKAYRDELVDTIKSVMAKDDEITPHDVALICILVGTKNLNQYFSPYESDEIKGKLKELKKNPQNKQLADMINYVENLITLIIACVFPFILD